MFLTFLWPQSDRATPNWAVINTISPLGDQLDRETSLGSLQNFHVYVKTEAENYTFLANKSSP